MTVIISMLRGVNLAGHNKISMNALRALYESLGLRDAQTYIQSGNVIFRTRAQDMELLRNRIANGIESSFGFRVDVILRSSFDLKAVIAKNPFAKRSDIEPSKLLVTFLASDPGREVRERVLAIEAHPEELRIEGRELYIYFPNGMARPKLSPALLDKTLKTSWTGRNWNTVRKLLEIAEGLEARGSLKRP